MNFTFNAAALANPGSWFDGFLGSAAPTAAGHAGAPTGQHHAMAHRQMVKLPHPQGQLIVCTEGTLWITVDGDDVDRILEAGDSFLPSDDSPLIASAMSFARMTVHPAAR